MERPPRGASYATSIRCSNCDADVAMLDIADHICRQGNHSLGLMVEKDANLRIAHTMAMVEEPEEMPVLTSTTSYSSSITARPPRPFIPQIDPFAINRTTVNGELTPASSHGSIGQSPVSPGAGRRSPFLQPPRKSSTPLPAIRRPPSPELLSQDCAFPPFPTSKVKSKNNKHNSKSSVRGRAPTPETGRSSSSFEREAKRSASAGAPRSRFRQGTNDSSRPSTANSSRQPSLSSRAGSRQGSIDQLPPLPPLQPSLSRTTTASDSDPRALEQPNLWQLPTDPVHATNVTQVESSSSSSPFPELAIQENDRLSLEPTIMPLSQPEPSIVQQPLITKSPPQSILENDPCEPSYKAKRPPPISSLPSIGAGVVSIPKPEPSPREPPPPTPTSTLARTLTNLFGRKRNQSTSSRKGNSKTPATDGPRFIALSPDPDPQEQIQSANSLSSSMEDEMASIPPAQAAQEFTQTSADSTPPKDEVSESSSVQVHEPEVVEEQSRDSVHLEQDLENTLAAIVPVTRLSTVPEQTEEMKRASIDSASSYGSEGFSHSRTSSYSTNALNAHSYGSSISTARTTTSSEDFLSPAFAKLRGADVVPDSPTDPYMQFGRLATVPETRSMTPEEKVETSSPVPASVPDSTPSVPESEGGYFDLVKPEKKRRPSGVGATRGVCRGCSQPILQGQKSVSSKDGRLTGRYHKECFVCKTCKEPFATADFYVHHDYPYCAHDYHVVNETLCESCGKGIEGHYLETSNLLGNGTKKFHPHCLRCATCKIQLNEDYFELGGRVYCERDAFRLINVREPRSPYGTAPSRPSPLNREYISSGEPGQALAGGKFPERRLTRLMTTY